MVSTVKGVIPPHQTTVERDAELGTPPGFIIFNTDDSELQITPNGGPTATWNSYVPQFAPGVISADSLEDNGVVYAIDASQNGTLTTKNDQFNFNPLTIGLAIGTPDHGIAVEGFNVDTKLHLFEEDGSCLSAQNSFSPIPLETNTIAMLRSRGTPGIPTTTLTGDVVGQWIFAPKTNGLNYNQSGYIQAKVFSTPTATAAPTSLQMRFSDIDNATFSEFTMQPDGAVVIEGQGIATSTRTLLLDFASEINLETGNLLIAGGDPFDAIAPTTTKGDLIAHDGATNIRVGVGVDGYIPIANAASAGGFDWFEQPTMGRFSQTDSVIVTNTTTETSIIGTGVGSLTIQPNQFKVGDLFNIKLGGKIENLNAAQTIRFRLYSTTSSQLWADSGVISLASITSAQAFELEWDFLIAEIGLAGTAVIRTNGNFTYQDTAGGGNYQGAAIVYENGSTFNSTVINYIDLTVEWGAASVNNIIESNMLVLHKVY
jgi:hypothetical protein